MRHWKTRTLAILPVRIAGVIGVLGRGHLSFEKLGVRAGVTSKQSPHLLLPLTNFGPRVHKVPAEIQPHISSDECAIYGAACDSSSLKNTFVDRLRIGLQSTRNGQHRHRIPVWNGWTRENPCDEARDYWENRKERWVRVHGIARRTLFDPMHDEQPFCHSLTERRRTTVRFLGQQNEVTIDDTWPQAGEVRKLWQDKTPPGDPTDIAAA